LIFSERIFDSNVDRGMPNFAACPGGSKHASATFFQSSFDHVLLLRQESLELQLQRQLDLARRTGADELAQRALWLPEGGVVHELVRRTEVRMIKEVFV
jgi:hypothetical protein